MSALGAVSLGVDFGGTAIKSAPVDTNTGRLTARRADTPTPRPATPEAVARAVRRLRDQFVSSGDLQDGAPVGVAIPAVVHHGVTRTAANIDPCWIGADAAALFEAALGRSAALLNDADAAGLAEMRLGAGRGRDGVVLVVTLGAGIGSALFTEGRLVRNTELGHLRIDGVNCCFWACAAAVRREGLTWEEWTSRLQAYLTYSESLLWPDLIIIGGAISQASESFLPLLRLESAVVRAELLGDAGIVGAAMEAAAMEARSARARTASWVG